jgi:ectoine hydroxylase-related dioxygenase (phytanoyl-CoA dioxygenase family)
VKAREKFERDGYVVIEEAIDSANLESLRRSYTSLSAEDDGRREGNYEARRHIGAGGDTLVGVASVKHALIEILGEKEFVSSAEFVVAKPESSKDPLPTGFHVDGHRPGRWTPFSVGLLTYLYDVPPNSGELLLIPGSHHAVDQYFTSEREGNRNTSELSGEEINSMLVQIGEDIKEGVRAFCARAGTVLIWHAELVHSGSVNTRDSGDRVAFFERLREA